VTLAEVAAAARRACNGELRDGDGNLRTFHPFWVQGVKETLRNLEADPDFTLRERVEEFAGECEHFATVSPDVRGPRLLHADEVARKLHALLNPPKKSEAPT
jgi:hypothetical protein